MSYFMTGNSEGHIDVDALFDESSDATATKAVAPETAHAAITMRPLGLRKEDVENVQAPEAAAYRSDFVHALGAPAAPLTRAATVLARLAGETGVLGVVARETNGVVTSAGSVDTRLEERTVYLARLAAMVGEELGLESFRELHVSGAHHRMAWIANHDGSTAVVVATEQAHLAAIVGKLPR